MVAWPLGAGTLAILSILVLFFIGFAGPLEFLALLIFALFVFVFVIYFVGALSRMIAHKQWITTSAALISCLIICAVAYERARIIWVAELVRLHIGEASGHYQEEIEKAPATALGRTVAFSWGQGGFGGTSYFYDLVYDEADEIGKPAAQQSEQWKAGLSHKLRSIIEMRPAVTHLKGHFYSVKAAW